MASLPFIKTFSAILSVFLDFYAIDGDHGVGADGRAAGAAGAFVRFDHVEEVVAFAVHLVGERNDPEWTVDHADVASLALLRVNDDSTFYCHSVSVF